jgi:hypothetical protein
MSGTETAYAPVATALPWYHETTAPRLFNEWTWTHFAWGMVSAGLVSSWWMALLAHTFYEAIESQIFPVQNRDVSWTNHVGDTVAFMAGRWALQLGGGRAGGRLMLGRRRT